MWVRLPPRAPTYPFCFHLVHALPFNLYPFCTRNFLHEHRIALPCPRYIGLKLFLARAHPGVVMLFCDAHALMSEQDRDTLDGHARKQQLHSKRIAEAMGNCAARTLRHSREIEQFLEARLPASHDAFYLSLAAPEIVIPGDSRRCFKRAQH